MSLSKYQGVSPNRFKSALRTHQGRGNLVDAMMFWVCLSATAWLIMRGLPFALFGILLGSVTYRTIWRDDRPVSFGLVFVALVGNIFPNMLMFALWSRYDDQPGVATGLGALFMTMLLVPFEWYLNISYALKDEPDRVREPPR